MLDGERHRSTDLVCSQLAIRSVSFAASRSAEEQRSTFMLCKMLLELTPGLEVARTEVALSVVSLEMLSFQGWTLGFRYPRELLERRGYELSGSDVGGYTMVVVGHRCRSR